MFNDERGCVRTPRVLVNARSRPSRDGRRQGVSEKLDRLVGERVFGWSIVAASDGEPIWSNDCGTPLAFQYASAPVKFGPNFSTDIAAAWEVVEHLRKQRSSTDAVTDPTWSVALNGSGDRWICDVADWRGRMDVAACDKTACMAICWAALRAVGVPDATIQEASK